MDFSRLFDRPDARRARASIRQLDQETLEEQLRIVTIGAPTLDEGRRAEYLCERFAASGLHRVHLDTVGNALALLPCPEAPEAPPLIISAHLDTVFPWNTDLTPRRDGDRVYAPGITDNARGLAALLSLARTLVGAGVATVRPIWFIATVGEEGNGDLRGSKHLFRHGGPFERAHAFIALDGSGIRRIVHRAIGARRLRVAIEGPGGHSWSDWGNANAMHALALAMQAMLRLPRPTQPLVTLTIARAGGGSSINAIPGSAWLELDLRSESHASILEVEAACRRAVEGAVAAENQGRRAGTDPLEVEFRVIGDRPSGQLSEEAPLVRAAVAATRLVGARPELVASSTDANVPLWLGIPAITLGAGGESGGIHTVDEWFCNRDGALGLERALLTILAVDAYSVRTTEWSPTST